MPNRFAYIVIAAMLPPAAAFAGVSFDEHFEDAKVPEEMREQRELIMSALTSIADAPDDGLSETA